MFYDVNNPDITLADWERLRKEFPRDLIDDVIDRNEAWLPDWFVPSARGVAIASDKLLRRAGYHNEKRCPHGWLESSPDYFLYPLTPMSSLLVRESDETICGRSSDFTRRAGTRSTMCWCSGLAGHRFLPAVINPLCG